MQEPNNLQPKKDYHEPMLTAEHILNQTMVRMFGCGRSVNAHIEKKKSKCDYLLDHEPSEQQMQEVEAKVNEVIGRNLHVSVEFARRDEIADAVDLNKLPEEAGDTLRIVKVGHYDSCACIGMHVDNTAEIGEFKIISSDYADGRLRIRYKLL